MLSIVFVCFGLLYTKIEIGELNAYSLETLLYISNDIVIIYMKSKNNNYLEEYYQLFNKTLIRSFDKVKIEQSKKLLNKIKKIRK